MALVPSPLINGAYTTKLVPTAASTTGSGSALQSVPKRSTRTIRLEINSIDRDYAHSPLSTDFRWVLPFPVKEIREIRLVGGTIPVPFLNIDPRWNSFTFREGTKRYTIPLAPGFYTIVTLLTTLQNNLNYLLGDNTYRVVQEGTSAQIKIMACNKNPELDPVEFALLFATGNFIDNIDPKTKSVLEIKCPARILGFGNADYFSKNGVLVASRLPNLWYGLERTYLFLSFDSNQDLRAVFRGGGRLEPSAIIYNDELNTYNFQTISDPCQTPIPLTKYLNKETYDINIIPAPAPISRISALQVSLRDMFSNPINTQGREVSLLLEMVIVD